jgi:hypothetical protein
MSEGNDFLVLIMIMNYLGTINIVGLIVTAMTA